MKNENKKLVNKTKKNVKLKDVETTKDKKEPKRRYSKSAIILLVGLAVIIIPIIVFAFILISAYLAGGRPINGGRFESDLDPAINKTNVANITEKVKTIGGVEDVEINLKTATFRILVDVEDGKNAEETKKIAEEVVKKVGEELAFDKYFKATDDKKMYDFEAHVYNLLEAGEKSENRVYYIVTKNSTMKGPQVQLVSSARDKELAEQLRKDVEDRIKAENAENNQKEDTSAEKKGGE